jgi:hypothetical protein
MQGRSFSQCETPLRLVAIDMSLEGIEAQDRPTAFVFGVALLVRCFA